MSLIRRRLYDDPQYGEKAKAKDYEAFSAAVIAEYGLGVAHIEGSTGPYRSVWVGHDVVGAAWMNRKGEWYYRLKSKDDVL